MYVIHTNSIQDPELAEKYYSQMDQHHISHVLHHLPSMLPELTPDKLEKIPSERGFCFKDSLSRDIFLQGDCDKGASSW